MRVGSAAGRVLAAVGGGGSLLFGGLVFLAAAWPLRSPDSVRAGRR